MTMHTLRTFQVLASLLIAAGVAAAPGVARTHTQPEGARPRAPITMSDDEKRELNACWQRAGQPRVLVLFFSEDAGGRRGGVNVSEIEATIASQVQDEIAESIGGLMVPSLADEDARRVADALARNAGGEIDADLMARIQRINRADISVLVELRATAEGVVPVLTVHDMRGRGSLVNTWDFRPLSGRTSQADRRRVAAAINKRIADGVCRLASLPQQTRIQLTLLGNRAFGFDQRAFEDVVLDLEEMDGIRGLTDSFERRDDGVLGVLELLYDGSARRFRRDFRDDVLSEYGLTWDIASDSFGSTAAFVYEDRVPEWRDATDPDSDGFERITDRVPGLRSRPELLILATADGILDSERAEVIGDDLRTISDRELTGELGEVFSSLGFRVMDASDAARRLDIVRNNMGGRLDSGQLQRAIGEIEGVDYVLHISAEPGVSLSEDFLARLFDARSSELIASQRRPLLSRAESMSEHAVDTEDAEDLSRFIAGRLVGKWVRHAGIDEGTLTVEARNLPTSGVLLALGDIAAASPGVRGIDDLQVSTPVAEFDVVFEGDSIDVAFELVDRVAVSFPEAEVQILADRVIFDFQPAGFEAVASRPERRDPPTAPAPSQPEPKEPVATEPAADRPVGSTDAMRDAMLNARDSVAAVGYRYGDQFVPLGTAWFVEESLLATNAHVAMGLLKQRDTYMRVHGWSDPGKVHYVARTGDDMTREFEITEFAIHSAYPEALDHKVEFMIRMLERQGIDHKSERGKRAMARSEFVGGYDVGTLRIVGGKGVPLNLADASELRSMRPLDPVGYVGFPTENIASAIDRPVMHTDLGKLMALTTLMHEVTDPNDHQLLHYDLTTAGGASGSPVFNASGHVVGLNSAGSYIFTQDSILLPAKDENGEPKLDKNGQPVMERRTVARQRIRTGLAYAQRIDLLLEAMSSAKLVLDPSEFQTQK